jgi:hypothetical protein
MPLVFSYGTLQQEEVQVATFGRRLQGGPDELPGFEHSSVPISDPAVILASGRTHHANALFTGREGSRLGGMAFEITDAELALADRYEQRAAYVRIAVVLASGRRAWAYCSARTAGAQP